MKRVLVFLLLMVIPVFGMAATIHVPGDQPTIQAGIDAAADGDTVLVAPGTYVENIDFLGKAIRVQSEQGSDVTIIDGNQSGSVVVFQNGEGQDSAIDGFTIRNGNVGGVYCDSLSSPTISDNIITDNSTTERGGGVICVDSSPQIFGNTITGNSGGYGGGGIYCTGDSSPLISGNSITNNTATMRSGGIFCSGGASPQIVGNTITGNSAYYGGGFYCWENSSPLISDNTIANNTASGAAGGAICCTLSNPVIINNRVTGNTADYAGGICVWGEGDGSLGMIAGNIVSDNISATEGGGIFLTETTIPVLNNIITDNSATSWGGGLYCLGDDGGQGPSVTNNIFTGNSADAGGGAISCNLYDSITLSNNTIAGNSSITYGGGIECGRCSMVIINTILWGNTAPIGPEIWLGDSVEPLSMLTISYSNVDGGMGSVHVTPGCTLTWGAGMIEVDPEFVSVGDEDYFLSQIAAGQATDSPCVDSGDPASDMIEGTTRTDFVQDTGVVDMGYHYPLPVNRVVTGPGPAYENPPLVRIFPPEQDTAHEHEFSAYGPTHYGVNVTCGDVDGDRLDEILTGAGPGDIYGPHVRGFEVDGTPLPGLSFMAYGTLKYGVNVACGDIDGDNFDEIITGAGPGAVFGPHVRGWDYDGTGEVTPIPGVSYFAYGTPKWGVNVSCGDIDGDGYDEIVTGAGPGAVYGPHVRGWNVDGGVVTSIPSVNYFAYGTLKYGVNVACGDIDGDGIDEIVTGAGPGAVFGPHVRGWNVDGGSATAMSNLSFFAWPAEELRYGANVFSGADLNGNGRDEIVVGQGPDSAAGTEVKVFTYDGATVALWFSLEAFEDMNFGTNVAAGQF